MGGEGGEIIRVGVGEGLVGGARGGGVGGDFGWGWGRNLEGWLGLGGEGGWLLHALLI